jgi:hypothetical protein
VTTKEQEKMRQSIEKEQETKSTPNSVTVMFHGRTALFGAFDSFLARDHAAPSLSETLTGDVLMPVAAPSLSALLKVSAFEAHARRRTRRRSFQNTEKFSAEGPIARSALAVLATHTTIMTEQRRCAAA